MTLENSVFMASNSSLTHLLRKADDQLNILFQQLDIAKVQLREKESESERLRERMNQYQSEVATLQPLVSYMNCKIIIWFR
jgi:chromosome segregation ATPase